MNNMPQSQDAIGIREWALLLAALLLLVAVGLRPSIRGNDGVGHWVYAASLLRGGNLDFSDEYAAYDALRGYGYVQFSALPRAPETGRPSNRYGIGASLLWLPFAGATHAWLLWRAPERADGLGRPYECAVAIATAFWTALGLILLFIRLRANFARGVCAWVLAGTVLATPLGFYMLAHGSMSHGVSFFAVTGLLLATERVWRRATLPACAMAGAWLGLTFIIRFQDFTWVVLCGAVMLVACLRQRGPRGAGLMAIAALAAGIVLVPQLAAWKILYGHWLAGPAPYLNTEAGTFSGPRYFLAALFGPRRGALLWHPWLAIGAAGLICAAWKKPWQHNSARSALAFWSFLGLTGLLLQGLLVGSWSIWYGGASFGNRFFISSIPALAWGVAWWMQRGWQRGRAMRWLWSALTLALIAWNAGLLLQYATNMLPREGAMPFTQIARQNIIDVSTLLLAKLHDMN